MQVFLHKLAGYRIANQECNSLVTGQKLGEILVKMRITFSNCSEFPTTQSQPSADRDALPFTIGCSEKYVFLLLCVCECVLRVSVFTRKLKKRLLPAAGRGFLCPWLLVGGAFRVPRCSRSQKPGRCVFAENREVSGRSYVSSHVNLTLHGPAMSST